MKFYAQKILLLSTLTLTGVSVSANPIPDAGKLLQLQSLPPAMPQAQAQIEEPTLTAPKWIDSQQKVAVNRILIQGNSSIATEQLNALVEHAVGQQLSLADLQQLAYSITQYYDQQGFPYSRAYLPEQNLSQGDVVIAVLEARYDRIQLDNQSRVSDQLLQKFLQPLHSGVVITRDELQHQLLLLERLHGVKTRNVMRAGSQVGTADLIVSVQEDEKFTGYVGLDNYGNEYTREWRANAGAGVHNVFGLNDHMRFDLMSSGHLNFGRVSYDALINSHGTRLGTSVSQLEYKLGKQYKDVGAEGAATQVNVSLDHPVWLSNQTEVILGANYNFKNLEDDVTAADLYRHRDIHVAQLRLDVSQKDQLAGGGITQYGVSSEFGQVDFKNAAAKANDLASANTQGDFMTVSAHLSRSQNLGQSPYQLHTKLHAQYSPDNLDSAQQFSVGGINGISGYENSVLSGSTGYYAVAELKRNLYAANGHYLNGKVYMDTASVKRQSQKWAGLTGDNQEQAHSAGFGLNWANTAKWSAALQVGFPIGKQPESLQERDDVQAWFSLSKHF